MTALTSSLPTPVRLIVAIVLSAAVHTLLLLGLGRYHAGVGVNQFPFENSGVLRVRIVNLAPDDVPTRGETPAPQVPVTPTVLSTPPTTGGGSLPPAPAAMDNAVVQTSLPLHEMYYRT